MAEVQGDQFVMVLCNEKGKPLKNQGKITGSDFTNIVIAYGKICLQRGFTIYRADIPCGYYKNQKGQRLELWTETNFKKHQEKAKSK